MQWVPNLPHRTPCDVANLKRLYPPCGVTNLQLVNLLHRADYVPLSAKYINCKGMCTSSENFGHANLYCFFKHLKHITIALNAFSKGTKKLPMIFIPKYFFYAIHKHVQLIYLVNTYVFCSWNENLGCLLRTLGYKYQF